MTTATIGTVAPGRPPAPGVLAACDLMATDWSPWHMVLYGLTWADYERLLAAREAAGRKRLRINYLRGTAEIMTPGGGFDMPFGAAGAAATTFGYRPERLRKAVAMLFEAWVTETGGDYVPGGRATHKRADRGCGFEPDECYYVQNWRAAAGVGELDLARDPPPDVVLEVVPGPSILDRNTVYAELGVPEVWRYDGRRFTVYLRGAEGGYHESAVSLAVPAFPFADATRFLEMVAAGASYAAIDRQFRAWVRQRQTP